MTSLVERRPIPSALGWWQYSVRTPGVIASSGLPFSYWGHPTGIKVASTVVPAPGGEGSGRFAFQLSVSASGPIGRRRASDAQAAFALRSFGVEPEATSEVQASNGSEPDMVPRRFLVESGGSR